MSRKDYLFFNGLGYRYKQMGEESEKKKDYDDAVIKFTSASECFGKADEIAKTDGMIERGVNKQNEIFCAKKAETMKEKSIASNNHHSISKR